MTVTHAVDAFREAFEIAVEELDGLIDRRFAARTIRVEATPDGRWTAYVGDNDIFPACPHLDTVERFIRAFARKEGVRVDEESLSVAKSWEWARQVAAGHSVRVDAPLDNVVPLHPEGVSA